MMLEQRLAECQRMNRESLALICMDVDNFKQINDAYGHATGDRLLASVSAVMGAFTGSGITGAVAKKSSMS